MAVKLRLKELRKSRRLTQAQVADGINCSAPTYSRYENGALSSYEKDMLEAFRKSPCSVQDDVVDFLNLKVSKKEALRP